MTSKSEYAKLLKDIRERGLNKDSVTEVMAIHNETGKKVIDLCGEPEKVVLKC